MSTRAGYLYGVSAYLFWGLVPLYFSFLSGIDAFEVVPWRVFTGLALCLVLVGCVRGFPQLSAILRSPRMVGWFFLSAMLLYANWQFFVLGVLTGRIIETALGYFINPLVTIFVGVLVRRERLRSAQWVAVSIAGAGVVVSGIAYGDVPWIALGIAFSFGFYGAVRKQVSEHVDALTGLTVETLLSAPFALVQLIVVGLAAGGPAMIGIGLRAADPGTVLLLLLSGAVTAIPLLLFGAANRRIPLSHLGFIQFITPVMGFLTGYLLFDEEMTSARWIALVGVWIALLVLIADTAAQLRRTGRARLRAAEGESV